MLAPPIEAPCCANCGLDIPWRPVVADGRVYCCGGCARGGPCYCSYDLPAGSGETRPATFPEEGGDASLHARGAAPRQRSASG